MPCFIRQIRQQGIRIPDNLSLFVDGERIEKKVKEKMGVKTHEELHQKIEEMEKEQVKDIIEKALAEVSNEKAANEYPDRMKEQRKKYAQAMQRVAAQ